MPHNRPCATFILALVLSAAACRENESPPPKTVSRPPNNSTDFMLRIDAALLITGQSLKDEALAKACRDAAAAGAGDAVLKGISSISSMSLRDAVAADCAISLRDGNDVTTATEVAKLISSVNTRDGVLKKLASGP
jgi:hypothetical protein